MTRGGAAFLLVELPDGRSERIPLSWTEATTDGAPMPALLLSPSSLRALVYMDEIFGYFPPVANPPSKAPLLTLLKQARAFGVGIVLATKARACLSKVSKIGRAHV